ncbi:hypothetical protein AAF712_016809 [Marasmius tenuissimus]|uniref:JmjC domain-containing protein n=1 Tax=Marasmius tenuissimus TaxID=585030 RepID=A0ABR2Z5V5_9AGAR
MYSLQDITTRPGGSVELETSGLVTKEKARPLSLHRFEWAFRMDYRDFNVDSDINMLTVHKDLIPLLRSQNLCLSPLPVVIDKAFSIMEYNKAASSVNERQRFEEFGDGPWEYILFPMKGRGCTLPPLYHRQPDGTATPLHFDLSNPDKLPHVTTTVHPLVVLFLRELTLIGVERVERSLWDHAVRPVQKLTNWWPLWTHNRFLPKVTSPKRKRPGASEYCHCPECRKWEYSYRSTSTSSSSGSKSEDSPTNSDSSDDSELWRDPEPVKEVTRNDSHIKVWSRQTEKPSEDDKSDPILEQYSMEASPPVTSAKPQVYGAHGPCASMHHHAGIEMGYLYGE